MNKTVLIFLIALTAMIHGSLSAEAMLEGTIKLAAVAPDKESPEKISQGSTTQISLVVKNLGKTASSPGKAFVRFVFTPPLDCHPRSLIFKTDEVDLPSIEPGKETTVAFKKTHTWPTIFDFIRHDWGMRQYQAVVNIQGDNHVIGTTHIAFSGYYYQGPNIETPVSID